jgi:eukaryotic-like serine/threonine-protein kinase
VSDEGTWDLQEGDEIAPGRSALKLLGGGHRYEAYLAWDEEMHSIVVAKLLRPHLVHDEHALRGLRKEADIIKRLDHPVLMRSFGLVDEGDKPHLVLEHLEGGRLSTLLRRQKRLALEQAIPLGSQLNSALIYMHNKGVVHLDVKPRNIIMGAPPRLIDLSVARTFERAAEGMEPIGTDAYMAPEQVQPKLVGRMGPASDVWGWGVTMYEAISGVLPFPKVDDPSKAYPQLHLDPAPMDKDVPPVLADLIMSTLEKRPEDRPTQREVADRLEPMSAALPRKIVLTRFRPRIN